MARARRRDEPLEFGTRGELSSLRSSIMINFLFHYSAIQIVGAENAGPICAMLGESMTQYALNVVENISAPPAAMLRQVRVARSVWGYKKAV